MPTAAVTPRTTDEYRDFMALHWGAGFLGNFQPEDMPGVLRSAELAGIALVTRERAHDWEGRPMPGYTEVRFVDPAANRPLFWAVFYSIERGIIERQMALGVE